MRVQSNFADLRGYPSILSTLAESNLATFCNGAHCDSMFAPLHTVQKFLHAFSRKGLDILYPGSVIPACRLHAKQGHKQSCESHG